MAETIKLPFAFWTRVGPMNHILNEVHMPTWEGAIVSGKQANHCKIWRHSAVVCAKTLNWSRYLFGCGLDWAEVCTSSIVFTRWHQCALMEGHVAVTCRITLDRLSTATMPYVKLFWPLARWVSTPQCPVWTLGYKNWYDPLYRHWFCYYL